MVMPATLAPSVTDAATGGRGPEPFRFSVDMFEEMIRLGWFVDRPRVELLDGEIVEMAAAEAPTNTTSIAPRTPSETASRRGGRSARSTASHSPRASPSRTWRS